MTLNRPTTPAIPHNRPAKIHDPSPGSRGSMTYYLRYVKKIIPPLELHDSVDEAIKAAKLP